MRSRLALCSIAVTAAALAAAVPASAKGGVTATLTTRIPAHAAAGSRIHIAWTLGYRDRRGRWHPFDGGGIFVRVTSAAGARATRASAHGRNGHYVAVVRVPKGGIGKVQIGIRGWTDGHRPADVLFPVTTP